MPRLALFALAALLTGCATRPPAALPAAAAGPPVVYEVFVRSLTPEGTLRAATARLDSIAALGADVVWLMPIQPNGEAGRKGRLGSPYAIRDYTAVDPRLGTMDDLRAFVSAAHARGLRVILDWVANHTAPDHAWVTAHPEWYTAGPDGARPVPPAGTDWFDTADLDYAAPGLADAMAGEMAFWLREADVDGFRCDVAGMVPETFWTDALARLHALRPGLFLLAEGEDPWLGRVGFDASYSWPTYNALKSAWTTGDGAAFVAAALAEQDAPPTAAPMHFVTNHDETSWDRAAVDLWRGPDGMRAAMAAAYGLGGTMLVYNGQEAAAPQRMNLFESETVAFTGPDLRPDIARWAALRAEHPALAAGRTAALAVPGAIAYTRTLGTDRAVVVVNPSAEARTLTLPPDALGGTDAFGHGAATARLVLPAYGVRVFVR
ncbi:MAG TPA: alpha-amylase family glycosyl hydrolase [Rubricoccaceae bacterium]|jgi:glycosidase